MEDKNTYTYTYRREKKKEAQRIRKIVIIVYAVLALLCIILGIVVGHKAAVRAREEELSSIQAEAESTTEEITTEDPSPYKPGEYTVTADGYSLKFRKEHTLDSGIFLEISDGTKITIDEIFHDENVASNGSTVEYWGKTTYKGYTGWVAMNYLKKAYSDNIITPDDLTTEAESTTAQPENTTQAPATTTEPAEHTTTAPEPSSEATTEETTTAARYTAGDYLVSTGGYTLTFRKTASKDGETILSIEDGTKLTVTKIIETSETNEAYRYWGEVSYKGHTGYVSMAYMKRAS